MTNFNPDPKNEKVPPVPREQAGIRPALVISVDKINKSAGGIVIVIPITTVMKNNPAHITVKPNEAGLTEVSYILCDHIRSVTVDRLTHRLGRILPETMNKVMNAVQIILCLTHSPTET